MADKPSPKFIGAKQGAKTVAAALANSEAIVKAAKGK
jgi:hypothetical protein